MTLLIVPCYAGTYPERKLSPSIKVGVYWKYSQTYNNEPLPQITMTVLELLPPTIVKLRLENPAIGGEPVEIYVDVTEAKFSNQFLVAEGLNVGDLAFALVENGVAEESFPITQIITRNILGRNRQVCHAIASEEYFMQEIFYDRLTGVMVETQFNAPLQGMSAMVKLIETNIDWNPYKDGPDEIDPISQIIILIGEIVNGFLGISYNPLMTGLMTTIGICALIGLIVVFRRKHKQPTAKIPH